MANRYHCQGLLLLTCKLRISSFRKLTPSSHEYYPLDKNHCHDPSCQFKSLFIAAEADVLTHFESNRLIWNEVFRKKKYVQVNSKM